MMSLDTTYHIHKVCRLLTLLSCKMTYLTDVVPQEEQQGRI